MNASGQQRDDAESVARDLDELRRDARREWRLIPQTLISLVVVAIIVFVREFLLR